MGTKTSEASNHPLVQIVNDRFSRYASDRQEYEADWNQDWRAWQRIWTKPWKDGEGQDWRSDMFVGITDLKVRIAAAAINETLFQGGLFPFDLEPTPEAEVYGMVGVEPEDLDRRIVGMKALMQSQLIQMKAERELKNAVLELVVMGSMVTKCPILLPTRRRRWAPMILGYDPDTESYTVGHEQFILEKHLLAFKHISLWDFYLDAEATGPQRWQGAEGCIHRGRMSRGEFMRFAQQSAGFIWKNVKDVLKNQVAEEGTIGEEGTEGPQREKLAGRSAKPIIIKEYWGVITKQECEKYGSQMNIVTKEWDKDERKNLEEYEVCVVTANDSLVKVIRNVNDGIRPFQYCRYNIVPHQGPGWGIPKNMRDSQQMLNSTVRGYADNLAFSSTVTGNYDPEAYLPGEDNALAPGLFKAVQPGRLKNAMEPVLIPNVAQYLIPAIEMFERYASEQSVPNLLGGRTDEAQPDTAYGQARMWEGAFKMLLDPTRNLDDETIKPIVEEFYHFNMGDTEVPDDIKADADIVPTGLRTFTDKNIRGARLRELLALSKESEAVAIILKFHPILEDLVKTMDENPSKYLYSMQEVERIKMLEDTIVQMGQQLEAIMGAQQPAMGGQE